MKLDEVCNFNDFRCILKILNLSSVEGDRILLSVTT